MARQPFAAGAGGVIADLDQLRVGVAERRRQQRRAIVEVVVEQGGRHPGLSGDVLDAQRPGADAGDHPAGGVEDLVTPGTTTGGGRGVHDVTLLHPALGCGVRLAQVPSSNKREVPAAMSAEMRTNTPARSVADGWL